MKIKEYKNKIVLAELDPELEYIMLVNPAVVTSGSIERLKVECGMKIGILPVHDVEKAIRFVEFPKPKKGKK